MKGYAQCLVFWGFIFVTVAHAETTPAAQGTFVVSQMRDSFYNLKQAAAQITQQVSAHTILNDIHNLETNIKTARDKAGITQAESQLKTAQDALDQSIAALYAKAYDHQKTSLYHKIYEFLQELFNDPIIKEKSNMMLDLQQEIVQRMTTNPNYINNWVKQIQEAGQKVSSLSATQEKAVDQLVAQAQTAKSQQVVIKTNPQLTLLEQRLTQKKDALRKAINELPTSVKIQIKQLQDEIAKSNLLLQHIQDPRKAINISPENLIPLTIDPTFATTQ